MKVSGSADLHASAETLFAAIADPDVLLRTLSGCQRAETVGPDHNRMTITADVASIKGTYLGNVHIVDQDPPHGYTLKASGSGAAGTIDATARITLTPNGGGTTHLEYDADAVVSGAIGRVGQRMLAAVAKKLAGEFFTALDRQLGEGLGAIDTPATGAAPVTAAAGPTAVTATPGVYSRPKRALELGNPMLLLGAAAFGALAVLAGVVIRSRLRDRDHPGAQA